MPFPSKKISPLSARTEQRENSSCRGRTKKPRGVSRASCKGPWRKTVAREAPKRSCATIFREKSEGGKSRAYTAIPSRRMYTSQPFREEKAHGQGAFGDEADEYVILGADVREAFEQVCLARKFAVEKEGAGAGGEKVDFHTSIYSFPGAGMYKGRKIC